MRLVLDANVVLSAALRDGAVRRALATADADLFAPAFLQAELDKHLPAIARRAGVRVADARAALDRLVADVIWVEPRDIQSRWDEAYGALGGIDAKDVPYLACALAVGADAIWSFDQDFDSQKLVPRVTRPASPE
jgi:predicted nucleic acid-binding protein